MPEQPDVVSGVVVTGVVVDDGHPRSSHGLVPVETGGQLELALYEQTYVEPVRRLNESLAEVLDVDAHPDRDPDTALAIVREAVDRFADESEVWLD